jgi:hypothetical protein
MIQIFGLLVVLQFVLICVHDLVDVPGWTHGKQVQEVIGRRKLWLVTAINAIFPGIAAAMAVAYWGQRAPRLVSGYWFLYFAITVGSAIAMWYIPYFFGASEQQQLEFERMYAGTRQVLPERGRNPRPNVLHLCFHVLFVVNLVLSALVWWRASE